MLSENLHDKAPIKGEPGAGPTSIETAAEENHEAAKRCFAGWPNAPMSQAIALQDGFLCGNPVMVFG